MGRARKQKHGPPLTDGKGRAGHSAEETSIPRQAKTSLVRHQREENKRGKGK